MAHSKSALKRWRQNEAHRERNKSVRSAARTAVRTARAAIAAGPDAGAEGAVRNASSILDRAARGSVLHPNAAARHKSRLARHLNQISLAPQEAAAPKRARKTTAKTAVAKKAPAKKPAARPRATKAKSGS